ncbi:DUF1345 domain-containing protein [Actinoplanes solisilvae]|uniref:DUF1345 domain-containing protein n=1 Tax=Actinoplanes solisilvae TaxID=2486853 RepID=UPI000FDB5E71|nr:DUF1345 domain-containing protein [Actinoplanes solisilvae]
MTSKATLFFSRSVEALLIVLGAVIFFFTDGDEQLLAILAWDLIAILYIIVRVLRLRRSGRSTERTEWLTRGLGGKAGLAFTIFTSIVGITAGLLIVIEEGDQQAFAKLVGLPAVLLAWAILHFGYAERYAKSFYAAEPDARPLAFPNIDNPSFVEFAYFSFTLGTTFSVSDVETQTTAIRRQILAHSILSFVYNTATVGIAVSVITG